MPQFNLQFFADESSAAAEPKTFDEAYVKRLREEAASWRTKYQEAKNELSAKEAEKQEIITKLFGALGLEPDPDKEYDKQLSEARELAQAAIKTANERLIKAEVKATAAELGIVDADAAYALMAKDGVKIDDAGNVSGVKEALTALVEAKPYLRGKAKDLGAGTNPGGQEQKKKPDVNDFVNIILANQAKRN